MNFPVRDFVGYGRQALNFSWPGGARLAISLVLNIEEGAERSHYFGDGANESSWESHRSFPAHVRDLMTESVFEYGSRRGAHRILDVLEDFGLPATIFASAVALQVNPALLDRLNDSPHEICGHGLRWTEAWELDRDEESAQIARAIELFRELTGDRPTGWYSRYSPSIHTRDLLVKHGFDYDSDAYNDDLPYYTRVGDAWHLVIPYTATYNDTKFAFNIGGPSDFLDLLKRAVNFLLAEGAREPKMLSIGLHARIMGQAGRADVLREFLAFCQDRSSEIWIARRDEIARFWRETFPAPESHTACAQTDTGTARHV
ncbi:polysaccharide deacetylase family protein [Sphaerimonospora sp. CA-214678]|uniref:polysaccharide deacetylase family protein n=1 Tax=Sphaerimonospora sp. CA-214678 TaxID=3240029 RepID=UPI003D8A91CB